MPLELRSSRALRALAMRVLAVAVVLAASVARAEPLPPGALEVCGGIISGTGVDAKRLGFGYQLGAAAAYQPIDTVRHWGITVRWSVLFSGMYDGTAEQVNPPLRTVMMDATVGARYRPWASPSRYLTARVGAGLFRSNDPISDGARVYVGPVSAVGLDQYFGTLVVGIDVRYALVPTPFTSYAPEQVAVLLRVGVAGP